VNYLLLFYMNIDPPSPEDSLAKGLSRLVKAYRQNKGSVNGD
jgi:hypothetical protein